MANNAKEQSVAYLEIICDLLNRYDSEDNDSKRYEIMEEIDNLPLCCEIRSSWACAGEELDPSEYSITLCTGGPAVRIIGDLDSCREPVSARIQSQDWFEPWQDLNLSDTDEDTLTRFASFFFC